MKFRKKKVSEGLRKFLGNVTLNLEKICGISELISRTFEII